MCNEITLKTKHVIFYITIQYLFCPCTNDITVVGRKWVIYYFTCNLSKSICHGPRHYLSNTSTSNYSVISHRRTWVPDIKTLRNCPWATSESLSVEFTPNLYTGCPKKTPTTITMLCRTANWWLFKRETQSGNAGFGCSRALKFENERVSQFVPIRFLAQI